MAADDRRPARRRVPRRGRFKAFIDEFPHIGHATASGHEFSLPALHLPLPSHDHNAFYYKPSRPSSPRSSFSLSCDQWRHDNEQEPFDGQIHVPVDRDKAEGALLLRIQASNLSKPASKRIPVRITITHVSAFESALVHGREATRGSELRVYSGSRSGWAVATVAEAVGAFVGIKALEESADGGPQGASSAGGRLAQQRLILGEQLLDRVEVGGIRRQATALTRTN